jgi:hypothetical protein
MDELIGRIVANVGVSRPVAEAAVGIILEFMSRQVPPETVAPLLVQLPGAEAAIAAARERNGSLPAGIGGIMGVGARLMSAGLGMDQIRDVTREILAFAREKVGQAAVDRFVAAIPDVNQFL